MFSEHASDETIFKDPRDACAFDLGPYRAHPSSLPTTIGYKFGNLRRTKEEADKDRQARQIEFDEWEERVFDDPDDMFDSRAEESSLVLEQFSRNDLQHGFLDASDVWARQGSGIGSLGEGRPDFSTYSMLPVPLSTVLDGPYIGGNHASGTVRDWEDRMGRYKKGIGAVQEDEGTDDDIVPLSLPGLQVDAITPSLSHLVLSDEDLQTLRSRFLLDQSVKNIMVLVGTPK